MHRRDLLSVLAASGGVALALVACGPADEAEPEASANGNASVVPVGVTSDPRTGSDPNTAGAARAGGASESGGLPEIEDPASAPPMAMKDWASLREFSVKIGRVFGTEDWSMFLYSLVRLHKPEVIVELGTGYAVTAFWMAQGLKENGRGHLWTLDDGRGFEYPVGNDLQFTRNEIPRQTRKAALIEFFERMSKRYELADQMTLLTDSMPPFPDPGESVDLLFSDFDHGSETIVSLLAFYLPRMSVTSSILVHSASSRLESYLTLEKLVDYLNAGKIPRSLLDRVEEDSRAALADFVQASQFQLVHLTTPLKVQQNSTAWIKIQPADLQAYPKLRTPLLEDPSPDDDEPR